MELDQKVLPLEAQLADLGPVEGVDLCIALQGHARQVQTGQAGNTGIQQAKS